MRFEYYQNKSDRQWRWRLRSTGNWKIIAVSSEGYKRARDCLRSIELVKSASRAEVVEVDG